MTPDRRSEVNEQQFNFDSKSNFYTSLEDRFIPKQRARLLMPWKGEMVIGKVPMKKQKNKFQDDDYEGYLKGA